MSHGPFAFASFAFAILVKMYRVLIYSPTFLPKVDGVSNRLMLHLRHLNPELFQVLIVCPDFDKGVSFWTLPSLCGDEEYLDIPIVRLPSFRPIQALAPDSFLANPFALMHLKHIMDSFRPDLVHFVGPDFLWLTFMMLTRVIGCHSTVPFLVSYHQHTLRWLDLQPISRIHKCFLRILFQMEHSLSLADRVIAPSKNMREYLVDYRGIRCDGVWPPAVDALNFSPIDSDCFDDIGMMRRLFTNGCREAATAPLLLFV
eukprot:Partr_v1_DN27588_c1_g1_i1_m30426